MSRFTLNIPNHSQKEIPEEIPHQAANDDSNATEPAVACIENMHVTPVVEELPEASPVEEPLAYSKGTEVIAELFGFVPTQILDTVINAMSSLIYEAIAEVEKYIEQQLGEGERTEKAVSELITLFESAFDKNFDKFELYVLQNVFNVPSELHLSLPGIPTIINTEISSDDLNKVDTEIEMIKRKILAKKYYQSRMILNDKILTQRSEILSSLEPILRKLSVSALSPKELEQLESLNESLSRLSELQISAEARIQQLSFRSIMHKADARSNYIASKITGFIEKRKTLESLDQSAAQKTSEWTRDHTKALNISSVDDLRVLNSIVS